MAFEFIQLMIKHSGTTQQDNKKKFYDEFQDTENTADPEKPIDYQTLFSGNNDDCFRIGIRFSKKQMTLFSNFYSSDVIIASPLGLQTIIGQEG